MATIFLFGTTQEMFNKFRNHIRQQWWIYIVCIVVGTLMGRAGLWFYAQFPNDPERIQFVAYLVGGVLIFFQIGVSGYRATVAQKTAEVAQKTAEVAQKTTEAAQKTAESTDKGNLATRFKNAIEHLGNDSASVRLGGIYALHYIAQEEEKYSKQVFEILCAHIRETTTQKQYKPAILPYDVSFSGNRRTGELKRPATEIQGILNLLFSDTEVRKIYKGFTANLEGANLQGADFIGFDLESARLAFSNLAHAILDLSNCSEVDFFGANLKYAKLRGIDFQNASLECANLESSTIEDCTGLKVAQLLQVTSLFNANMPDEMKNILHKEKPDLFEPMKKQTKT